MQHRLTGILWVVTLLLAPWAMAQSTQPAGVYDNFDHAELSAWQGAGKASSKVDDKTLVLRQTARFKHMPLLSEKVFDLDLASQQHPIDLTVQLVATQGSRSNVKEHNNFELGWVDEKGKTVFGWRWEFLREGRNQANRMFNGKVWSGIWWTKSPQTLFAKGDVFGLRVTDTVVQMLRNGKMIRSVRRPAEMPNISKCRLYLSFKGPRDQATITLDNVSVTGIE